MLLKEKHDSSIKARGCADGRSQRYYMTKAETISPTMSLEAMILSCTIDTKEGRHVAVTDIPGAFPTRRHGPECTYAARRHYCGANRQIRTKTIQKIHMEKQERQTNAVREVKKSTVQNTTSSINILETAQ